MKAAVEKITANTPKDSTLVAKTAIGKKEDRGVSGNRARSSHQKKNSTCLAGIICLGTLRQGSAVSITC